MARRYHPFKGMSPSHGKGEQYETDGRQTELGPVVQGGMEHRTTRAVMSFSQQLRVYVSGSGLSGCPSSGVCPLVGGDWKIDTLAHASLAQEWPGIAQAVRHTPPSGLGAARLRATLPGSAPAGPDRGLSFHGHGRVGSTRFAPPDWYTRATHSLLVRSRGHPQPLPLVQSPHNHSGRFRSCHWR